VNRVYVPLSLVGLRALHETGEVVPGPACAVTASLRTAYAAGEVTEQEDLEYVAMTIAARMSLTLLDPADPADRRRVVAAADAAVAEDDGAPGHVLLTAPLPLARVASVHVDTDDLRPVVDAAVRALPAAARGDQAAVALVEALDTEDLAWFAVQELPDLL